MNAIVLQSKLSLNTTQFSFGGNNFPVVCRHCLTCTLMPCFDSMHFVKLGRVHLPYTKNIDISNTPSVESLRQEFVSVFYLVSMQDANILNWANRLPIPLNRWPKWDNSLFR